MLAVAMLAALAARVAADLSIYPLAPVQTPGVYSGYAAYDPTELQGAARLTPSHCLSLLGSRVGLQRPS